MKALARRHESAATKEAAHEIDHVDGVDRAAGHAAAGEDRLLVIACSSWAQPSASINAAGGIPGAPLPSDRETGEPFTPNTLAYDFSNGTYFAAYRPAPDSGFHRRKPFPESTWSPDAIAGSGVR